MFAKADPTGLLLTTRSWAPDPRINQTDADITAEIEQNLRVENTFNMTLWSKSYQVNLLVCVDQYQVCNPSRSGDSGCTKLGGQMSTLLSAFKLDGATLTLGFNMAQLATASRLLSANTDRSMYSNVSGRGGAALNGK
jgi:hypothetical protein